MSGPKRSPRALGLRALGAGLACLSSALRRSDARAARRHRHGAGRGGGGVGDGDAKLDAQQKLLAAAISVLALLLGAAALRALGR